MSPLERRLVSLSIALIFLAFMGWFAGGGRFLTSIAQASPRIPHCIPLPDGNCYNLYYYGADISTGGKMAQATGVQPSNNTPNGPWPQAQNNYCFLAVVQAIANYQNLVQGYSMPFPSQSSQSTLLSAMNNYMVPSFGPVPPPTGFTLADTSRDFGGDPRAQSYAAWYETPNNHFYHQYIYHTGVDVGSYGLGKGVSFSHWNGPSPEIAIVNHGAHSVIVAGVWSYGNPSGISDAEIDSFAVYNPWNQGWGEYLNGAYYERVSYSDWTSQSPKDIYGTPSNGSWFWWGQPYNSNGGSDPDPVIGIYQAGPGTNNPSYHHWINYYVSIQRDDDANDNANYCHDENGNVMQGP